MALEILTVGATVKYAFETTSGTRPTTGYTELADVVEAPEISLSLETIDVSNITDTVTRYAAGRQDPGGEKTFVLNHVESTITAYEALVETAETNIAQGKRLWFEYCYPNATKSFFWCGMPRKLGNSGITGNSASQINAAVVFNEYGGWLAKST